MASKNLLTILLLTIGVAFNCNYGVCNATSDEEESKSLRVRTLKKAKNTKKSKKTKKPQKCKNQVYDDALQRYHDDELKKMEEIPFLGNITLKEIMLDSGKGVLNKGYRRATPISDMFGYSFLWNETWFFNETFKPVPKCTDQSFGDEGQWTDAICNTTETLREACATQESNCDPKAFPTVVAGTSDVIQASATKLALVGCLLENQFDFETCQDPAVLQAYRDKVGLLNNLIKHVVPNGFNNILFTNFVGEYATRNIKEQNTTTGPVLLDLSDSNFL